MKTFVFNTVEELEPLVVDSNLVIKGHLTLTFDLSVDINIKVAGDIKARDIDAWNIDALNIKAGNIKARNIKALNIDAWDIDAWDIDARDIDALDISYYAVCFAYESFICVSLTGRRKNHKHFCLDSEVIYREIKMSDMKAFCQRVRKAKRGEFEVIVKQDFPIDAVVLGGKVYRKVFKGQEFVVLDAAEDTLFLKAKINGDYLLVSIPVAFAEGCIEVLLDTGTPL